MVSTDDLGWTYCCNHLMACVDRHRMLLQNIHKSSPLWAETDIYRLTAHSEDSRFSNVFKTREMSKVLVLSQYVCWHDQLCSEWYSDGVLWLSVYRNWDSRTVGQAADQVTFPPSGSEVILKSVILLHADKMIMKTHTFSPWM